MTRLLIVESPAKARTIQGFFRSQDLHAVACSGHVRDLPSGRLGVDLNNGFAPEWVITAEDRVVERLRNAVKAADEVLLGTDADREGEAIAWHLRELIRGWKNVPCRRVRFREVTPTALHRAVAEADEVEVQARRGEQGTGREQDGIHMGTVHAQFARRVVDRLIGFSLSPRLWAELRPGASIGRVQAAAISVAHEVTADQRPLPDGMRRLQVPVRLSFDDPSSRQQERRLGANVTGADAAHWTWYSQPMSLERAESLAGALRGGLRFRLEDCVCRDVVEEPPPPPGTAALIEEAEARWGMVPAATMQAAQQLYEGIEDDSGHRAGLITYPRTDSEAVAPAAREAAERWIEEHWSGAQIVRRHAELLGPHEAIRPTRPGLEPRKVRVSREAHHVYELIWQRLIRACLPAMRWREYRARLSLPDPEITLTAEGRELVDAGWQATHELPRLPQDEEPAFPGWLSDCVGASGTLTLPGQPRIVTADHPLAKPALSRGRFIRMLSETGVGRPSTWVGVLNALESRGYLKQDGTLQPGPLSFEVSQWLEVNAPWLLDLSFTSSFEDWLDEVEVGDRNWQSVVQQVAKRLGGFLPKK